MIYGAIFDLLFIPVWTFRSVTIIDSLCVVFSHRSVSLHGENWMERSDWLKYQNSGGAESERSLRSDPLQFHFIAPQIKKRSLIVARLILRDPGSSAFWFLWWSRKKIWVEVDCPIVELVKWPFWPKLAKEISFATITGCKRWSQLSLEKETYQIFLQVWPGSLNFLFYLTGASKFLQRKVDWKLGMNFLHLKK